VMVLGCHDDGILCPGGTVGDDEIVNWNRESASDHECTDE